MKDHDSVQKAQVGGTHYKEQTLQHWDYVLLNNIPYMEAQIIKYVSRWRGKNGIQDLEKARHFLDKLIAWESMTPRDRILAITKEVTGMEPSRVKATGWEGYVFEGATGEGYLYTCKECGERFMSTTDIDPKYSHPVHHPASHDGSEPGPSYINQG